MKSLNYSYTAPNKIIKVYTGNTLIGTHHTLRRTTKIMGGGGEMRSNVSPVATVYRLQRYCTCMLA